MILKKIVGLLPVTDAWRYENLYSKKVRQIVLSAVSVNEID